MGFVFYITKSHLNPTQFLPWLGVQSTQDASMSLTKPNVSRLLRRLRLALATCTCTRRQWESLLGALNFASDLVPLGRLHFRRLLLKSKRHFAMGPRDVLRSFPVYLYRHLMWWFKNRRLQTPVPWVQPVSYLKSQKDASDLGWGYQLSYGLQGQRT